MRILAVEDDPGIADFIRRGLEDARYQVEVAADGGRALEVARKKRHDLLLLEVRLPVRSGIEVCQEIRRLGLWTPILMVTALDSVGDRVKGLEAGADDYLCKPFALEELVARVRALLRRYEHLHSWPALQIADLVLDRSAHEVRRSGELLTLTPKEFELLEYLMRRAGRVVTRRMIEEQVWGYHHDPMTNVVDVYVSRLRQKIDQGRPRRLLQTVRGVGYRLKP